MVNMIVTSDRDGQAGEFATAHVENDQLVHFVKIEVFKRDLRISEKSIK